MFNLFNFPTSPQDLKIIFGFLENEFCSSYPSGINEPLRIRMVRLFSEAGGEITDDFRLYGFAKPARNLTLSEAKAAVGFATTLVMASVSHSGIEQNKYKFLVSLANGVNLSVTEVDQAIKKHYKRISSRNQFQPRVTNA